MAAMLRLLYSPECVEKNSANFAFWGFCEVCYPQATSKLHQIYVIGGGGAHAWESRLLVFMGQRRRSTWKRSSTIRHSRSGEQACGAPPTCRVKKATTRGGRLSISTLTSTPHSWSWPPARPTWWPRCA